jgi:hypothetical protein
VKRTTCTAPVARSPFAVPNASLTVRSIWAACLIIAAVNHALVLLRHGLLWDYGGVGRASALYWSSLTILDPLAAALLFMRPKAGVVATILLIVTNVVHNLAVTAHRDSAGGVVAATSNPFVAAQIGFMLLVFATALIAWRGSDSSRQPVRPR